MGECEHNIQAQESTEIYKEIDIERIIEDIADDLNIQQDIWYKIGDTLTWMYQSEQTISSVSDIPFCDLMPLIEEVFWWKVTDEVLWKLQTELSVVLREIQSWEFIDLYTEVSEKFPWNIKPNQLRRIYKKFPNILKKAEFWDFSERLSEDFNVERRFLRHDIKLFNMLWTNTKEYNQILRSWLNITRLFPDLPQTNSMLVDIIQITKDLKLDVSSWEVLWSRRDKLFELYPLEKMTSEYNWKRFLARLTDEELYTRYISQDYIDIAESFGENLDDTMDISLMPTDFYGKTSQYHKLVNVYTKLWVLPNKLAHIYWLLGTWMSDLSADNIENLTEYFQWVDVDEFISALEKFLSQLPDIQEHLTVYSLHAFLKSYKVIGGNLDALIDFNVLLEGWWNRYDLDAKDLDKKKTMLVLLRSLWFTLDDIIKTEDMIIGTHNWHYSVLDSWEIIFNNKELFRLSQEPDFRLFFERLETHFPWIDIRYELPDILRLYQYLKENPTKEQLLFDSNFWNYLSFMWSCFQFKKLWFNSKSSHDVEIPNIATFPQLLDLYDTFPEDTVKKVVSDPIFKWQTLYANDITLLFEYSKNPQRFQPYLDPSMDISGTIWQWFQREHFWHLNSLINSRNEHEANWDTEEVESYDERIAAFKLEHEERWDLKTFPLLERLRIWLLATHLRSQWNIDEIWRITSEDIVDVSTEYGWIISFSPTWLEIESHPWLAEGNGSYVSLFNENFHGGISMFHLHAIEIDNHEYAWPSWSDTKHANIVNTSGIVFSTLWHPKDKTGSEDESKILLNIDYYFIDKRNPKNEMNRIYDLWVIEVPFQHL